MIYDDDDDDDEPDLIPFGVLLLALSTVMAFMFLWWLWQ